MYQKANQMQVEVREKMRGGAGSAQICHLLSAGQLPAKCRLLSRITLEPNCGIGYHVHQGETEIFYFLAGEAQVDDNGDEIICRAGDVQATPSGCGHAVYNAGSETVKMVAVIIKDA